MTASDLPDPSLRRAINSARIDTPDPEHSLHVALLSLQFFDQLMPHLELDLAGRDYLAAAALWHDAGQRRSMREHHKASFDLIFAEVLPGFTREEKLVVASIARYHRHHAPSIEHPGYRELSRAARTMVDQMAALLRLAEGLDASHLQLVKDVKCVVFKRRVEVGVSAAMLPMNEIERARARSGLFREVFHREIAFTWQRRAATESDERTV